MSANDWWKPTTPLPSRQSHSGASSSLHQSNLPGHISSPLAQSSHTPNFYNNAYLGHSQGGYVGTPTRMQRVGDELDEEDTRMAEASPGSGFVPWMASSPVHHKTGGGQSPLAGGRSPAKGKSPEGNANSPFRNRQYVPNAPSPEEDLPPTTSLRDSTSGPSSSNTTNTAHPSSTAPAQHSPHSQNSNSPALPTPSALQHTPTTTKLLIFGPPTDVLSRMRPWLEECGAVAAYHPGPAESNYWVVEYENAVGASWALRRYGEFVGGRWLVGFRVADGSLALGSATGAVGGEGDGEGRMTRQENGALGGGGGGVGTPIQVKSGDVLRPLKPAKPAQTEQSSSSMEVYNWDQEETAKGLTARAAEWFFGR